MSQADKGWNTLKVIAGERLLSQRNEYHNDRTLLSFICIDCDETFYTTKYLYEQSADAKRCNLCKKKYKVTSTSTHAEYIRRCMQKHGNYYSYDLLPDIFKQNDKITVICPHHGQFLINAGSHRRGAGCTACGVEKTTAARRRPVTEFVVKSNAVHNFRYNYSHVKYINSYTPVDIMCPQHGIFQQLPVTHTRGSGCPKCISSAPVREIYNALERFGILYVTDKIFPNCKHQKKLRFDIYVPELNLCIEYDGIHHFQPTTYGGMTQEQAQKEFDSQVIRDDIKNQYCKDNNIDLIRISYMDYHPGAIVVAYISSKIPERFVYSYQNLECDVKKIANYIKSFNYDKFAIYGIKRGGIPFALPLTYIFEDSSEFGIVSYQRYDGNDKRVSLNIQHPTEDLPIFVIDDLTSSGITMTKVITFLQNKFKKAIIHPIVVFGEDNEQGIFFINPHPKQWIVFPYEI